MVQYKRIGEILLEKGLITKRQFESALQTQLKTGLRFGEILTASGAVTEDQVAECLAEQYDYPVGDPDSIVPEPKALSLVERGFALSRLMLPVAVKNGELECLICDPLDVTFTDSLAQQLRLRIRPIIAPPTKLLRAIERAYGADVHRAQAEGASGSEGQTEKSRPNRFAQKDRDSLLIDLLTVDIPPARKRLWTWLASQS